MRDVKLVFAAQRLERRRPESDKDSKLLPPGQVEPDGYTNRGDGQHVQGAEAGLLAGKLLNPVFSVFQDITGFWYGRVCCRHHKVVSVASYPYRLRCTNFALLYPLVTANYLILYFFRSETCAD